MTAYYPNFTAEQKAFLKTWTINATYPTGIDWTTDPALTIPEVALNLPQVTNNLKDMIHGIHAGKDRTTNPFRIARNRSGTITLINSADIGFPGILANCQSCHTYNGYSGVPANTLASRDMANDPSGVTDTTAKANSALATLNATDLMTTPFTASCNSCHDSVAAKAHMQLNGGQISVARSTLNSAGESCSVCHGAGATYDPVVVHL